MKLNELCEACGLRAKKEHKTAPGQYADPCIGILPGVKYGCCGHQGLKGFDGYLFFETGVTIRFETTGVEHKTFSIHHSFNDETTTTKTNE